MQKLHTFSYKYDAGAGPLSEEKLNRPIAAGNCRLAVQDFLYVVKHIYLPPKDILLPRGYTDTGDFVAFWKDDQKTFFDTLEMGDIIYAEKLRNKKEEIAYKPKETWKDEDDWIRYFHSAIYLGPLTKEITSFLPVGSDYPPETPLIWHSSFVAGGTVLWSVEKFCYYYQPVAAKRILS